MTGTVMMLDDQASTLTRFTPEEPLMLVTDYPPSERGGGAVIVRSLLADGARARVLWASPTMTDSAAPGELFIPPPSSALSLLLRRRSVLVDSLLSRQFANALVTAARIRRARALWMVMHGTVVHVAARVLAAPPLPIHLTVHDDPAFGVALMSRRYAALVPFIERDFAFALRRAQSVDVISRGMAQRYHTRYGVNASVVHRGMATAIGERPPHSNETHLDVGVMGNTYGYGQLPPLALVVAEVARRVGRRGRITVVGKGAGARLQAEMAGRVEVDVVGHLDEAAATARLARCFALFLNYPFSRRAAVLRQTSFPTKLSSYLMAARPLLVNAPDDSSIAELATMSGYVGWWSTRRIEDGVTELMRLWSSPASHQSQHLAAERVRGRYYDLQSNRTALFSALDALVPVAR